MHYYVFYFIFYVHDTLFVSTTNLVYNYALINN